MAMLHNVAHYGQLLSPKRAQNKQPADLPTREDDYNGVGQYLMGESVSGCATKPIPYTLLCMRVAAFTIMIERRKLVSQPAL